MKKNYLEEMMAGGYRSESIDDFHLVSLPYIGDKFFRDKNSNILDIGAGAGHSLIPLKIAGWKNLWALDIDDLNREFFSQNNINFNKGDADKGSLPYEDGFFDAVLSFHLIEHLSRPENYLEEARRILKKNGKLVIVTPDWRKQYKTFWRDHTHIHPYDKESIVRILRAYGFHPVFIKSFGVLRGIGRTKIWKYVKPLMFTGMDMIAVSAKE